jgi:hypothetical protein
MSVSYRRIKSDIKFSILVNQKKKILFTIATVAASITQIHTEIGISRGCVWSDSTCSTKSGYVGELCKFVNYGMCLVRQYM